MKKYYKQVRSEQVNIRGEERGEAKRINSAIKGKRSKILTEGNVGIIKVSFFTIVLPHMDVCPSNLLFS